jgi:hypothetical protein
MPRVEGRKMMTRYAVAAGVLAMTLSTFAVERSHAQSDPSPYYGGEVSAAPLPPPGIPAMPRWRLAPRGDKPVIGSVDAGPGLDGPNVHDLAGRGYVQEEFFIEGHANV